LLIQPSTPPAPLDRVAHLLEHVQEFHPWSALFLGNGLSMNVWPEFGYWSLFERAKAQSTNGLSPRDRKPFAAHDTTNFEVVLAALNTSMRSLEALNYRTDFLQKSYPRHPDGPRASDPERSPDAV
jgi:Domain of unknown function (DUF4917)